MELRARSLSCCLAAAALLASVARSQASDFALRFYGTDAGQKDRVRIQIDDDEPGPDRSEPIDVGAASFTLELWVRGNLADNATSHAGGDVEFADESWLAGNHIVDREVVGGTNREWGVSLAGGFVRFGTGSGDDGTNLAHTLEGDVNVLDGAWHHVACVRDQPTGTKHIYVDGVLDMTSSAGVSTATLSYPNQGAPGQQSPWGPWLVLGARKHPGQGQPGASFSGYLDELRVWRSARAATELAATFDKVVDYDEADLVGYYRFEEGSGPWTPDSSAALSRAGQLSAGVPGQGEWVARYVDALNTAPVTKTMLPPGFARTMLTSALVEPTVLACPADGRVLIGERGGRIVVWQNGALLAQPLITLAADTAEGERGLVGLVLDPQFAQNGWLYVHYTTLEPRSRVSRVTVIGNTAEPASELVVWENPEPAELFHHGGAIAFGADGHLYIATGDQFASANAQLLSNQHGKLLRLEPDGAIPADNPFVGTPGVDPAIWAYGLRNPFRMALDPLTGALWIGDVGGNTTVAWEELVRAAPGANYGWPEQEGSVCNVSDCSAMQPPVWAYRHDDAAFVPAELQGCIVAGAVYRGSAFPSAYQGNVFVADYANRWIRRLVLDAQGAVSAAPVFMTPPDAGSIVDLEVGADGALYYVTLGLHHSGAADAAALQRIEYVGTVNQLPEVAASATPAQGLPPLVVHFSSAGTLDPDNGPSALTYAWDFGDGSQSSLADPDHVYTADGPYQAVLTVDDGEAQVASNALDIAVGNAPVPTILLPPPGTTYRAGDSIYFKGEASDVEDGVIDPSSFAWRIVMVHESHTHPFLGPLSGATGSFTVPVVGHAPAHTYFVILLEATDSSGLSVTQTLQVMPETTTFTLDSFPAGVPVFVDGDAVNTPSTVESVVGFQHWIEAQPSFGPYEFHSWSNRRPRAHTFVAGSGVTNLRVRYAANDSGDLSSH